MAEITLKEHLQRIAKERWKNASKEDKAKHAKMMNQARWRRVKLEKAAEEAKKSE